MYPTKSSRNGGIFVTRRLEELARRGHEVHRVAISASSGMLDAHLDSVLRRPRIESEPLPPFEDARVTVGPFGRLRLRNSAPPERLIARASRRVLKLMTGRYDLVHAHGMFSMPAGWIARNVGMVANLPVVITLHGSDVHTVMTHREKEYREVLSDVDRVVAVSESLASDLRGPKSLVPHVRVINNGFDPRVFRPGPSTRGSGPPRVAYVGSLREVKGADRLVPIFRALSNMFPKAHFDVVGDGPLGPMLRTELKDYPVAFHGVLPQGEVAEVLRNAELVIMPSRKEGFPCLIPESHAVGTPVLGVSVGGVAEAIGDVEFTVPADGNEVASLIARAGEILENPRHYPDLQRNAQRFTWSEIVNNEISMYEELVDQRF